MLGNFKVGIRLTVVSFFVMITLVTGLLAISLQYYFGMKLARQVSEDMYVQVSQSLVADLNSIEKQSINTLELLTEHPALSNIHQKIPLRKLFTQALQQNPLFYGLYIGNKTGDFYEIINLEANQDARITLKASPTDRWVEINISGEEASRKREFSYLNGNLVIRATRDEFTDYDPRQRSWYQEALADNNLHQTDAYLFAQLQAAGQTLSKPLPINGSVLGIDLLLTSLSDKLHSQGFGTSQASAYIFTDKDELIASSDMENQHLPVVAPEFTLTAAEKSLVDSLPVLQVSNELNWPPIDYAVSGVPRGFSIDVLNLISQMTGLRFEYVNGETWLDLVSTFKSGQLDLLQSVVLTDKNREWGLPSIPYVSLPFAIAARSKNQTLLSLRDGRLAIARDWSIIPIIKQRYPDITIIETDDTLSALLLTVQGKADAALDNKVILEQLIRQYALTNLALNDAIELGENEQPNQLHIFVHEGQQDLVNLINRALTIIGSHKSEELKARWLTLNENPTIKSNSLPIILTEMTKKPDFMGKLQPLKYQRKSYYAYITPFGKNKFFGVLVPRSLVVSPFLKHVYISLLITALLLTLMLPLSLIFSKPIVTPIRELAKENEKIRSNRTAKINPISSHIVEIDELSKSIVRMVNTIKKQAQDQRDLLDSFIQLIAEAIDLKSPYTGGHCARVPDLALMLVEEANNSETPAFKDFKLGSEDSWREIRIAAWLHDCGKIITPEYIVDKGTKLETIHNRIHEIRMRFEVLWRDAEIECLIQCQQEPNKKDYWQQHKQQRQQELKSDFEFIAQCNVGGEYLDEAKQARLKDLAAKEWTRHFSDRQGLSHVEAARYSQPESPLPVVESLLRDAPEHRIARERAMELPSQLRIKMDIPELLYNRGELHNLLISRGTLTEEDRFKINEHMISTIRMLEALPFPDELAGVPRIASTHHETLDGKGYPRKLQANDLSIPEKILAVADVFEALTAVDRPYKVGKTLKQTLDILFFMVKDNHLDPHTFELLLTSNIHLIYAKKYLNQTQIDEVDIQDYLNRLKTLT